ncbi:MAG: ABC transporter substrate-binding protein [Candidatus Bipolaricaulaceae bacterium]
MWRKISWLIVAASLCGLVGFAQEVKNPDTLVYTTYGSANTLDPAYAYDTASGEIMFQVYENLLRWPYGVVDADDKDLSFSLAIEDLQPMLATNVPEPVVHDDGSVSYTFDIRQGVKFHEGGTLTPADVEYTFERAILQDRDGGPIWMFIEPLLGKARLYQVVEEALGIDTNRGATIADLTPEQQAKVYNEYIDPVVEVSGNSVVFTLPGPYPPFLTILTHGGSWGSILDKEWVIEQGGWDGQPDSWAKWYNPGGGEAAEDSELYDVANGTGPFKLANWDVGVEVVFERFDGYWREPAQVKTYIIKKIQEWSDRLLLFQRGDVDICQVDPQYLPQVVGDVDLDNLPETVVNQGMVWQHHLPRLSLNPAGFFVSDVVVEGNDLVGSGQWGEDGIPSEFFNDVHTRKAFAYAFDYDTFIEEVYTYPGGEKTHGPVPKAFDWAYKDDPDLYYTFDMEKAEEHMRLAHDGKVWETGFTFTLLYNEGNDARRVICEILEANIEAMNPKFHIDVRGVPWSTYLDFMVTTKMPLFVIGWLADFPDPHNFVVPFAHSTGTFSGWQGDTLIQMFERKYDPLIAAAMATTDQEERAQIYYQIEEMSFEDCYDLWLPQVNGYRNLRDWVQGYPFNPVFPGPYAYLIYKAYE